MLRTPREWGYHFLSESGSTRTELTREKATRRLGPDKHAKKLILLSTAEGERTRRATRLLVYGKDLDDVSSRKGPMF